MLSLVLGGVASLHSLEQKNIRKTVSITLTHHSTPAQAITTRVIFLIHYFMRYLAEINSLWTNNLHYRTQN